MGIFCLGVRSVGCGRVGYCGAIFAERGLWTGEKMMKDNVRRKLELI